MLKLAPTTEQFQHFVSNLRESFWATAMAVREAWKKFFEADSERQLDRYAGLERFQRRAPEVSMLIRLLNDLYRQGLRGRNSHTSDFYLVNVKSLDRM